MPNVSRLAQLRQRLDLPLVKRATGALEGRHRSQLRGHGDDFDDLSLYSPGDDVGDIDWKSSARAGAPVIKRFVSERNVALVLAVDTGRTMTACAASGESKADVVQLAAALISYVARDRGDRVALVAANTSQVVQMPARGGTSHLEVVLRHIERAFGPEAPASASNVELLVHKATACVAARALVVLITDEANPCPEHEVVLRRLRRRHDMMVISIMDADPLAPPTAAGPTQDVTDDWEVPAEVQGRKKLRAALDRYRSEHRAARAALLARLQISDVMVAGTDDLVPALVAAARRRNAHR